MRVIDPGHKYALRHLDGPGEEIVTYVKREGKNYPGNVGSHPGTTLQDEWRAQIHRLWYLDNQKHCHENWACISNLRENIIQLELRAAVRHGRPDPIFTRQVELMPFCHDCGHIGCEGTCHG